MKTLFLFLFALSPAFALTCPSGFVEISQAGIYNATTGELYNGQITLTRAYNDSSSRGDQQTISIVNGAIDVCLRGNYTIRQRGSGSGLTIAPYWTVPSTGGPYTIPDIEGDMPVTPQTSVAASQISGGSDGQCLVKSSGVSQWGGCGGVAAAVWGAITGTLSSQTDLQSALGAKEPTISAGSIGQYWRWDKTWQALNAAAVANAVDQTGSYANPSWITSLAWAKLTGIPSTFAPSAHAASHQNGGSDEVGTSTPAANAIPKAGVGGTLAAGWIPTLNQNTTGTAAALAANGTNCSTGSYAKGVDASGNAEGCTPLATVATSGLASDLAGTLGAGQLPNPSATTLGGVKSLAAVSHQFLTAIGTAGAPSQAQPAFTDISGAAAATQLPTAIRAGGFAVMFRGSDATAGTTLYLTIPYACTITDWVITGDSTATIKLWRVADGGTLLPDATNTLNPVAGLSLATGTRIHSTSLSNLSSTAIAAYDTFGVNLFASASTHVEFTLGCQR